MFYVCFGVLTSVALAWSFQAKRRCAVLLKLATVQHREGLHRLSRMAFEEHDSVWAHGFYADVVAVTCTTILFGHALGVW